MATGIQTGTGKKVPVDQCPCGSSRTFSDCCEPQLTDGAPAATAEALMRSRYTAYVLGRNDYVLETWHPGTRPPDLDLDKNQNWLGLKVLSTDQGGEKDDEGMVEFVARFKIAGRGHRLHEISRFTRHSGRWLYLDGQRGATDSSLKT